MHRIRVISCILVGACVLSVSPVTYAKTTTDSNATVNVTQVKTSAGFAAEDLYDVTKVEIKESKEKSDAQDFSDIVIAKVNNYVNVRSMPSEEGEIVGKLYDKSVGEYLGEENGWYQITSGNCKGYVKAEYCVVGEEAQKLAR